MQSQVLVVDDEDAVREGLGLALEMVGWNVITCADAASAEIVVENEALDLVLCDVRLSGPLSIDGIDLIDHVRSAPSRPRIVVMSGGGLEAMAEESMRRGATDFLDKPFPISALEALLDVPPREPAAGSIRRVPSLASIVEGSALTPRYQPIVDLHADAPIVAAYEGLIRLTGATPFGNPELLFEYARRKTSVPRLDLACLRQTIGGAAPLLAGGASLFVNVSPLTFGDPGFARTICGIAGRAGVPLDRLVVEITEQDPFGSHGLPDAIAELAAAGIRFAFDDVGSAHSHLMQIEAIRPRFLKISQHFGSDFEREATKEKIVRNIVALARDFGCDVILEGVETAATLDAARGLGIRYAQGYHIARPAPASAFSASLGMRQRDLTCAASA